MVTIVIKLDAKADKNKLVEAIEMLKGVNSVTIAGSQGFEDSILAKKMTASRRSGKGNKDKVMDFLSVEALPCMITYDAHALTINH